MGYYLERDDFGRHGKAEFLIEACGAIELIGVAAPEWRNDVGIVCVVNNGPFEAAGYAFSPQELSAFIQIDDRPKRWLIMDKTEAARRSGYRQH